MTVDWCYLLCCEIMSPWIIHRSITMRRGVLVEEAQLNSVRQYTIARLPCVKWLCTGRCICCTDKMNRSYSRRAWLPIFLFIQCSYSQCLLPVIPRSLKNRLLWPSFGLFYITLLNLSGGSWVTTIPTIVASVMDHQLKAILQHLVLQTCPS